DGRKQRCGRTGRGRGRPARRRRGHPQGPIVAARSILQEV
ncbi:hypothetical protein AVDCRST_MAG82-2135, partial [uncultured Rubrobacteraceae bacterium]